jgi:hypothetical protein
MNDISVSARPTSIDLDAIGASRPPPFPRRLLLVVLAAVVALVAAYTMRSDAVAAPDRALELQSRLIVPASAAPGERLVVLAYRNPELCGPTELRLDGAAIPQQVLLYEGQHGRVYPNLFLALDLPASISLGTHRIALFGPVPSTGGTSCGDVAERRDQIATSPITIRHE